MWRRTAVFADDCGVDDAEDNGGDYDGGGGDCVGAEGADVEDAPVECGMNINVCRSVTLFFCIC